MNTNNLIWIYNYGYNFDNHMYCIITMVDLKMNVFMGALFCFPLRKLMRASLFRPPFRLLMLLESYVVWEIQHLFVKLYITLPLPSGTTPPRKVVTEVKKKTTARTDALIRHEVMMYPLVTAASLKKKHAQILQEVSVRTIQHLLQKDKKMPCRRLPRNLW